MTAAHAPSSEGSTSRLQALLRHDTTAGFVLVMAAVVAIAACNQQALRPLYESFLETKVTVALGSPLGREVAPRDVGAQEIGHFGFFRRRFEASLWAMALDHLGLAPQTEAQR